MSVRFLGRRVSLALAVVLASARLSTTLEIPVRTLQRWRQWWRQQFPLTPLWQANCARFMPPPAASDLFPAGLLERFAGTADALMRLLVFLSPITAGIPSRSS